MAQEIQSADQNYDTIVEVVDVTGGRLLASARFPFFANQFADRDHIVHKEVNPDGTITLHLLRMSVEQDFQPNPIRRMK
jgi:hypothetical protein